MYRGGVIQTAEPISGPKIGEIQEISKTLDDYSTGNHVLINTLFINNYPYRIIDNPFVMGLSFAKSASISNGIETVSYFPLIEREDRFVVPDVMLSKSNRYIIKYSADSDRKLLSYGISQFYDFLGDFDEDCVREDHIEFSVDPKTEEPNASQLEIRFFSKVPNADRNIYALYRLLRSNTELTNISLYLKPRVELRGSANRRFLTVDSGYLTGGWILQKYLSEESVLKNIPLKECFWTDRYITIVDMKMKARKMKIDRNKEELLDAADFLSENGRLTSYVSRDDLLDLSDLLKNGVKQRLQTL